MASTGLICKRHKGRALLQYFSFTVTPDRVASGPALVSFPITVPPGYIGRVVNVFARATLDPESPDLDQVVHNVALAHEAPNVGIVEAWGVAPANGQSLSYTPGASGFPGAPEQTVSGDLRNAVFSQAMPLLLYYGVGAAGAQLVEPAKFALVVELSH